MSSFIYKPTPASKKILLEEQVRQKIKSNNGKYSLPQTINAIVKQWEEWRKEKELSGKEGH
mgnify:CR=1 FL=1